MKHLPHGNTVYTLGTTQSADNTEITTAATVTVSASDYGVLWKLWVDLDVGSEADIENLVDIIPISVTIGSTVWSTAVHPYTQDTTNVWTQIDVGPWFFDFSPEGLASNVRGDDIVIAVGAAGTGVKTKVCYIYS